MRNAKLFALCMVGGICLWWLPVMVAMKPTTLDLKNRDAVGVATIAVGALSGFGLYELLAPQRRRK